MEKQTGANIFHDTVMCWSWMEWRCVNYWQTRVLESIIRVVLRDDIVKSMMSWIVILFLQIFVSNGTLEKTSNYPICLEFQVRVRTLIHFLIWIMHAPDLSRNDKEVYADWLDSIIHTDLPDFRKNPELFELQRCIRFTNVQKHARNIKMENIAFIMVNFSQTKPLLLNQYQKIL